MVIPNTCPNLSNIVHTDFELGRVIQTVTASDPGITALMMSLVQSERVRLELVNYCQYSHIFAKDTNVWTTVGWTPN